MRRSMACTPPPPSPPAWHRLKILEKSLLGEGPESLFWLGEGYIVGGESRNFDVKIKIA